MSEPTSKSSEAEPVTSPSFPFTIHPTLAAYKFPYQAYLERLQPKPLYGFIASGACTFHPRDSNNGSGYVDRILLIQRASTDSMPDRWEIPGGAVDPEDHSILHGVARELFEEASLKARSIGPYVGEPGSYVFATRGGNMVSRLNFLVEVDEGDAEIEHGQGKAGLLKVKLDPNEHQDYIWATEEECKESKVGELNIEFTTVEQKNVVLEAFRVKAKTSNWN